MLPLASQPTPLEYVRHEERESHHWRRLLVVLAIWGALTFLHTCYGWTFNPPWSTLEFLSRLGSLPPTWLIGALLRDAAGVAALILGALTIASIRSGNTTTTVLALLWVCLTLFGLEWLLSAAGNLSFTPRMDYHVLSQFFGSFAWLLLFTWPAVLVAAGFRWRSDDERRTRRTEFVLMGQAVAYAISNLVGLIAVFNRLDHADASSVSFLIACSWIVAGACLLRRRTAAAWLTWLIPIALLTCGLVSIFAHWEALHADRAGFAWALMRHTAATTFQTLAGVLLALSTRAALLR